LALLAPLVLVVAGCGTAAGKTKIGAQSNSPASKLSAQSSAAFYGVTMEGGLKKFANGKWAQQPLDLRPGEKVERIFLPTDPQARPLVTVSSTTNGGCNPSVRQLEADGTLGPSIVSGYLPSLSPNGDLLAYLVRGPVADAGDAPSQIKECGDQHLVVKNLHDGSERSWLVSYPAKAPNYRFGYIETALAWSPDSTFLVVGTQDAQLYRVNLANWTKNATLRNETKLRSGKRILDAVWNYSTSQLFVNGTKPEGSSVVLDQINPATGVTLQSIDTGVQAFPFAITGAEDQAYFLRRNYTTSSEHNGPDIVSLNLDGASDLETVLSNVPELSSMTLGTS